MLETKLYIQNQLLLSASYFVDMYCCFFNSSFSKNMFIDICLELPIYNHIFSEPCSMMPCLNGGSCSRKGFYNYTCNCALTGYKGETCDIGTNLSLFHTTSQYLI